MNIEGYEKLAEKTEKIEGILNSMSNPLFVESVIYAAIRNWAGSRGFNYIDMLNRMCSIAEEIEEEEDKNER